MTDQTGNAMPRCLQQKPVQPRHTRLKALVCSGSPILQRPFQRRLCGEHCISMVSSLETSPMLTFSRPLPFRLCQSAIALHGVSIYSVMLPCESCHSSSSQANGNANARRWPISICAAVASSATIREVPVLPSAVLQCAVVALVALVLYTDRIMHSKSSCIRLSV